MSGPVKLPRVSIVGRLYYQDDRLREFRAVHNPYDVLRYDLIDPSDELVIAEPPRTDHEAIPIVSLRSKLDGAEFALVAFGMQLANEFGVCPEFEENDNAINNIRAQQLHDQFWALQSFAHATLNALREAAGVHAHDEERAM